MANISNITSPTLYSTKDINLLNAQKVDTFFDPSINYIEYNIISVDGTYKNTEYNYTDYSFLKNGTVTSNAVSQLDISPENDLTKRGLTVGDYNVYYNFYNNELLTSPNERYLLIKSISPDRTELTVKYTSPYVDPVPVVNNFFTKLNNTDYFQDFYLNFGDGNVFVANNIAVNSSTSEILINLYNPLPSDFQINDDFWVVTQVADPLAFNISFPQVPITPPNISFPIKGPNLNLNILDRVNNSTDYQSYSTLITSSLLSTSYSQLNNLISSSELNINIDYTDFSNFIQFSSANQRIKNFIYKKQLIDNYQREINVLNNLIIPSVTSSNISILTNKINDLIENFDSYEYFLYYDTGSWSYPKSTSTIPYTLYDYGLENVLTWLGSEDPNDDYYGGILLSASLYDKNNPNYLYNSTPFYIQNDTQNDPYRLFIEMVAQHYDNIWIYYKDVTNKYKADNRLDYGISKDLIAESLKSFGVKLYQNNFSTNDLYSAFLGYGNPNPEITGSAPVASNSFQEYIDNYITASYDASVMPLDDYNKEVYKRIYSNLPYLLKTKGTIPGLKALINCFGVPDTILRISEFGGRDKDTSTYDHFYNRYSYAFAGHSGSDSRAYPQIPWAPLTTAISSSGDGVGYVAYNYVLEDYVYREGGGGGTIPSASLPSNIEFRFKTNGIPSNYNTQSLLIKTNTSHSSAVDDWGIGIFLNYNQPFNASSPYYNGDGSVASNTPTQGNLYFILNAIDPINIWYESPMIQLPFFDGGWWSIMLQRDKSPFPGVGNNEVITYTLYVSNKLYDSEEGNTIGFIASSSIVIDPNINGDYFYLNEAWNSFNIPSDFTPYEAGVYLGGHYSGSNIGSIPYVLSASFDGYFQEFRYYSLPLDIKTFEDYTMNPTSIEGLQLMGASSSFNILGFRAALGNELWWDDFEGLPEYESPFVSTNNNSTDEFQRANSVHPAVYAGNILTTQSFFNTNTNQSFSDYALIYPYNPNANTPETFYVSQNEIYYFDQPIAGIKNRVTDKIQIVDSVYPTGSVLSQFRSLEQIYPSLSSESPDINLLEVAFSPQNEINDDIVSSLGYFNIGEYIGDPRDITSREVTYPDLVNLSSDFFKKYFDSYSLFDYIRLIKYFDNSLFKMIQDFVPARTSLTSGVVIKQHLLERNKYPQPLVEWEDVTYSGSIDTAFIEGGTGGTFDSYNFTGSVIPPTFINNTQSWGEEVKTPIGLLTISHSTQDEFYNGELPNSIIIITNGELNEANPFKEPPKATYLYKTILYSNSVKPSSYGIQSYDITPKENFLNPETSPNGGEIYLWFDDSTYNIGAPEIDGVQYGWNYYSSRFSTEKVKFIKINRIDSNGTNRSNILSQCQSITISLPDSVHTYPVYGISSVGNYFLYSIGPYLPVGAFEQIGNPNTSSLGEILSYNFLASKTTQQTPIFVPSGIIGEYWTNRIQGFTSITDNSNGSFNITNGSYTFGQTPNKILQVRISGSGVIDPPGTTTISAYMVRNDGVLIESDVVDSSYSGGNFDITLVLSSSNAKNYLTENATFGFGLSRTFGFNYLTCSTFYVSMSLYNTTPFAASQSQTSFDPTLPEGVSSFTYNDYNAIIDNALESVSSNIFMDVDYSNNPIIPVNQNAILNGIASKAQVQDSNYNSTSWSRIRYKGSKYNSIKIS